MSFEYGLTEQNEIMKILNITSDDEVQSIVMDKDGITITTHLSVWTHSTRNCTCACTCGPAGCTPMSDEMEK